MGSKTAKMQAGRRRQKIEEIAELTGTEEHSIKKKRLSAQQLHAAYREITGEEPVPRKGRGWHIKEICEELDRPLKKSWRRSNLQTPADVLEKIAETI